MYLGRLGYHDQGQGGMGGEVTVTLEASVPRTVLQSCRWPVPGRERPAGREEHVTVLSGWTVTMLDPYLRAGGCQSNGLQWLGGHLPWRKDPPPPGLSALEQQVISFHGACQIHLSLSHGAPGAGHVAGSWGLSWGCD